MRRALACAAVALLAGCGGGGEDEEPRPRAQPALGAVSEREISVHLRRFEEIAGRHGDTRAAGTAGERETAEHVADTLRRAGWKVELQDVEWPVFENRRRPVLGDLRYRADFVAAEYSASKRIAAARVRPFDDRGCDEAAFGELSGDDVAVVVRGTCTFRAKALNAQRAGAGALVVVDREEDEPVPATLGDPEGIEIPVLAATGDAAARLVRAGTAEVRVETTSELRTTQNVLAETKPRPDGRWAMAGGHLDSVEEGPGVNDNGSGLAALLEAGRRLTETPGIRLGFWTAEEVGLFGSRHYVRELSAREREAIEAYINLDMVGTPDGRVLVYDTDDEVEELLREVTEERGEEDLGGDSDHAPFDQADIPIGGIFTGLDRCYHRACDVVENTDPGRAADAATSTQRALTELAR